MIFLCVISFCFVFFCFGFTELLALQVDGLLFFFFFFNKFESFGCDFFKYSFFLSYSSPSLLSSPSATPYRYIKWLDCLILKFFFIFVLFQIICINICQVTNFFFCISNLLLILSSISLPHILFHLQRLDLVLFTLSISLFHFMMMETQLYLSF